MNRVSIIAIAIFLFLSIHRSESLGQTGTGRSIIEELQGIERGQSGPPESIAIPIQNGTLRWHDLLDGVAKHFEFDIDQLHIAHMPTYGAFAIPILPSAALAGQPLLECGIPETWVGMMTSLSKGGIQKKARPEGESLVLNVPAIESNWRDFSRSFRDHLSSRTGHEPARLERIESSWKDKQPSRIVIICPGFQSTATGAEEVAKVIHARLGLACMIFHYPNDAPITESADRLGVAATKLAREYPQTPVSIVAHSMGGLVAREALESGRMSSLPVDQLIQVFSPNRGSELADYAGPLEMMEHIYRSTKGSGREDLGSIAAMVLDGMGEAKRDLRPDSTFLRQLNERARLPSVSYTCLAGTSGPVGGPGAALLNLAWSNIQKHLPESRVVETRVDRLLACPEIRRGKGDGIVSVQSAQIDGVSDLVRLDCNHLSWGKTSADGEAILAVVIDRLTRALKTSAKGVP